MSFGNSVSFGNTVFKKVALLGCPMLFASVLMSCSQTTSSSDASGTLSIGISNGGQQLASASNSGSVNVITYTSIKVILGRISIKSANGLDSLDFRQDTPLITTLNLDTTIQDIGSISIPPGTYDETRFRIAKLDSADAMLYTDNVDMRDISIRADGYLNGFVDSVFVWTTSLNVKQVHKFTPVTIAAGDTVRLVFEFDVSQWFSDGAGGRLDPRMALTTGSVQSQIENNVKAAFRVYQN